MHQYPRTLRSHPMTTRGLAQEFNAMPGDGVGTPGGLMNEVVSICESDLENYKRSVREMLPMAKVRQIPCRGPPSRRHTRSWQFIWRRAARAASLSRSCRHPWSAARHPASSF